MRFSPKQLEYFSKATHRYNFKVGAVRSGKSYGDIAHVILYRIRRVAGLSGLNVILGVSKATIERNVLEPMREIYGDRIVGRINSQNVAMIAGEPVHCLGAEKMSQVAKIQGASIKYFYGDEIAKWNREVFEMLPSRMDKDYSCMDGACNPETPTHWLKKFIDRDDIDIYVQHYTIFDNPFLPKSFVKNLCIEYEGTVYYKRFILGEWALAEGLVYPSFNNAVIDDLSAFKGVPSDYVLSIDYGTQNAFAALLWAKYEAVWVCIREYYYSGRDNIEQKTDEDYVNDLEEDFGDVIQVLQQTGSRLETIVDPSAASFIAALNKRKKFRCRKADNSVADGIRETNTAFKIGAVKIMRTCRNFIDELNGYVWDSKAGTDKPVKVRDHAADACRYFIRTRMIVRRFGKKGYKPVIG